MIFNYKAKSKSGEIYEGKMEGQDKFTVASEILKKGDTPLSVFAKEQKNKNVLNAPFSKIFARVKMSEKIVFTRNLSGMLKAGLPLSRSISVLQKQSKNEYFNSILSSIKENIDKGDSFSSTIERFPKIFSPLFVSMVRAGEESGNLSGSLNEIGINLEKANSLTKKVKGALIYPGVILSVMVLIGILMFIFVVPTLAKTFADIGTELPPSTKLILGVGDLFSAHPLLTFLVLGIIVGLLVLFFRAKFMIPVLDKVILKLPMIGTLAKELNTARTARTISSLINSGVPITRAIDITVEVVQNTYYKNVLKEARAYVEKGMSFSSIFKKNTDLYPIMASEMMEVGEETGQLSDLLLEVASFYEEEIDNKTKNLSTIIEPVLMVFIGGAVGFFAVSMISPMYSVMDGIK